MDVPMDGCMDVWMYVCMLVWYGSVVWYGMYECMNA